MESGRYLLNYLGLESVSIRRIQGVGYSVLEFFGVRTTFDIFQNIIFLYSLNTAYCLSWIRRIGLVSFVVFVQNAVKEDPALNKKVLEATEAYTKNFTNLTELFTLAESSASIAWSVGPQMTMIENTQASIQSDLASLKTDTFEIKSMMIEIFCAFKGQSFSTPSSSMPTTTLAITKGPTTFKGETSTHTAIISPTKETPSQTEGEKAKMETEEKVPEAANVKKELVQEPQDLESIPITIPAGHIIDITPLEQPESPQVAPRIDRGKGIARDTDESPSKLVKASTKVHSDPDTMVLVPYEIHGKMLGKHELIKIVYEEATKAGVEPKALSSAKHGQKCIKIQDAAMKVLKRERLEKLAKAKELRKKRID
ncbi:hypothetical protein Tco_1317332 [Tanacetum coccineum]